VFLQYPGAPPWDISRMDIHTVFSIEEWDEKPYQELDGIKLVRARYAKRYRGELAGSSVTESLMVYTPGGASFVAHERVDGTVDGRAGSFVVEWRGTFVDGILDSHGVVIAGSGTGALAGVGGEVPLRSEEKREVNEYPMTFRLRLP